MPNRSVPPPISQLSRIPFPQHQEHFIHDKIPVVRLHSDAYEVVKIEILFNAGRLHESKNLVGKTTNMLLKSGTSGLSRNDINEIIDFHGATISLPVSFDHSAVVLYSLSKYVKNLIPTLLDILQNPQFPQEELDFYSEQQKSKLKVALENVDTLAYRTITESIFGRHHPYGYNSIIDDYDHILRADLVAHHKRLYHIDNCRVFVSGNISDSDFEELGNALGSLPVGISPDSAKLYPLDGRPQKIKSALDGKVQSAIKIGRRTFNRQHKDYQRMYILNTLLGGYFGSRLSMNIREKKGYTYGIHSSLDAMAHDGCFLISTEVDNTYVDRTLEAIYAEIEDLKNNLVHHDELSQMKNYLMGYFLNSVDGVFRSSSVIRGLKENGVGKEFFDGIQKMLYATTANDIRDTANEYLNREDLWEVVVG